MLYCTKCQVLSRDEERCPLCGGKKLRQANPDDPVLLYTTGESESVRIAAAFDDEKIPHMERSVGSGGYVGIILGQTRNADVRIFVPFGELEHAKDVLIGIGCIKEAGDNTTLPEEQSEEEEEKIPMSRGRKIAVRIFSLILLIGVIWAVVSMADTVVSCLKSAFHLFQ